jgi:hypothetical protein
VGGWIGTVVVGRNGEVEVRWSQRLACLTERFCIRSKFLARAARRSRQEVSFGHLTVWQGVDRGNLKKAPPLVTDKST